MYLYMNVTCRCGCFHPRRKKKEIESSLNNDENENAKSLDELNNSKQSEINQSESLPDNGEAWDLYWEDFEREAV